MNRREVQQLVAHMAAAWPHINISAPTVAIWSEHLAGLNYEAGLEAVYTCERSLRYFPTVAEFLEAYQAIRRRQAESSRPALPAPAIDPDVAKRHIAEMKQILRTARGPLAKRLGHLTDPPEDA